MNSQPEPIHQQRYPDGELGHARCVPEGEEGAPDSRDAPRRTSPENHAEVPGPQEEQADESDSPPASGKQRRKPAGPTKKHLTSLYVLSAGLVVTNLLGAGVIAFRHHQRVQRQSADLGHEVDKGPRVAVTKVQPGAPERTLTFPADARAVVQTTVYAKTSGYVREIRVDKGDHVKKDDVLAIVESPETDQQVVSARSDLNLKDKLAVRARLLNQQGLMSTQDRETAEANQQISRATLERALALAAYEIIRAPFSGVVSARYVDPGALLPAATSATQSALPLLDIVDPETLKATVFLGQDLAPFVLAGDPVEIWQDERPDRKIDAKITRIASSLDPKTRTMLVEIQFDNRAASIFPGTFVRVRLKSKVTPLPTVPSDALFVRKGKLMVGRIEDNHIQFVPVTIGVNTGKTTQIASGVTAGEDIALDVPAEVDDGARVQVAQAAEPAGSGSASAGRPPAAPSGNPDSRDPSNREGR